MLIVSGSLLPIVFARALTAAPQPPAPVSAVSTRSAITTTPPAGRRRLDRRRHLRRNAPHDTWATFRDRAGVSSSAFGWRAARLRSATHESCGSRCTGCRVRRCPVGQRVEVGYLISGKASPGERCHGWSVSTMGAPDGLLTRSRSASDQRVVIIGATAKAKATLRKGRRDRVEVVRRHLRGLVARRAGDGSADRGDHREGAGRSRFDAQEWAVSVSYRYRYRLTQATFTTPPVPANTVGMTFGLGLISNGTPTTADYSLIDPGTTTTPTTASYTSATATVVPATFALTRPPSRPRPHPRPRRVTGSSTPTPAPGTSSPARPADSPPRKPGRSSPSPRSTPPDANTGIAGHEPRTGQPVRGRPLNVRSAFPR